MNEIMPCNGELRGQDISIISGNIFLFYNEGYSPPTWLGTTYHSVLKLPVFFMIFKWFVMEVIEQWITCLTERNQKWDCGFYLIQVTSVRVENMRLKRHRSCHPRKQSHALNGGGSQSAVFSWDNPHAKTGSPTMVDTHWVPQLSAESASVSNKMHRILKLKVITLWNYEVKSTDPHI